MADSSLTFHNVSPAQYAALGETVHAKLGVTISGNSGQASKDGVTVGWVYAGDLLTITIIHRSFFDPSMADLLADISNAVNQVLGVDS